MRRSTIVLLITAVVGLTLLGGIVLSAVSDDEERTAGTTAGATGERAPELEDHSADDLPAVERAARRFLAGYLPLIYGKDGASIGELRSASPQLLATLRVEGARVTPAQAQRTPRLQRVSVIKDGASSALATAQIKDSPSSPAYQLVFHLGESSAGWVVTRIGGP